MKRILMLLLAAMLLTSCSAKKPEKAEKPKVVTEAKKDVEKKKTEVKKEEKTKIQKEHEVSRTMTDEEVLEELKGVYFSCDYIDNFKTTKSAVAAKSCFAAMIVSAEEDKTGVMQIDGHQGSDRSYVENIEYDGKGSYIVSFAAESANEMDFDIDLKYTPGSNKIQGTVKTVAKMWEDDRKVIDFYKYNDFDDVYYELSAGVFDGYTATFVEKDRVGFEYEDEIYTVQVRFDIVEDSPLTLDNANGFLFMTKESTGEESFGKYACDGQVLTVFDADGNVFAQFRKPNV